MNKQERAMMVAIQDHSPALATIKETGERYSRWDAYNDVAVVEFKHRGNQQHWGDTMIELDKYKALTDAVPKTAVYAVYSCGNLYLFNLTKLARSGYNFGWHDKNCNKTTKFYNQSGNGQKVSKLVGMIQWDDAERVIPVKL